MTAAPEDAAEPTGPARPAHVSTSTEPAAPPRPVLGT